MKHGQVLISDGWSRTWCELFFGRHQLFFLEIVREPLGGCTSNPSVNGLYRPNDTVDMGNSLFVVVPSSRNEEDASVEDP